MRVRHQYPHLRRPHHAPPSNYLFAGLGGWEYILLILRCLQITTISFFQTKPTEHKGDEPNKPKKRMRSKVPEDVLPHTQTHRSILSSPQHSTPAPAPREPATEQERGETLGAGGAEWRVGGGGGTGTETPPLLPPLSISGSSPVGPLPGVLLCCRGVGGEGVAERRSRQ